MIERELNTGCKGPTQKMDYPRALWSENLVELGRLALGPLHAEVGPLAPEVGP